MPDPSNTDATTAPETANSHTSPSGHGRTTPTHASQQNQRAPKPEPESPHHHVSEAPSIRLLHHLLTTNLQILPLRIHTLVIRRRRNRILNLITLQRTLQRRRNHLQIRLSTHTT